MDIRLEDPLNTDYGHMNHRLGMKRHTGPNRTNTMSFDSSESCTAWRKIFCGNFRGIFPTFPERSAWVLRNSSSTQVPPNSNIFFMLGLYYQRRGFCIHGVRKTYCLACGGRSICSHGIRKTYCTDCGGGSICKHGKRRIRCVDCAGKPITCHHGKPKSTCYECSLKCSHLKPLRKCHICTKLYACKHDKLMFHCRECRLESTDLTCNHSVPDPNCNICWFIDTFGGNP